ncbi:MAG: hypothetical protein ACREDI_15360, partial [Roseiarcus sp.]
LYRRSRKNDFCEMHNRLICFVDIGASRRELELKKGKMTVSSASLAKSRADGVVFWGTRVLKEILNHFAARAEAAADRARFAALPVRYLDDIGMTAGERAAILGYGEPARDPWALIAIQRL